VEEVSARTSANKCLQQLQAMLGPSPPAPAPAPGPAPAPLPPTIDPTDYQLKEWQVLVELRYNTGFANWSGNKDGWDTLEEHHDPSRCGGVTMESGKITKIDLSDSNLAGGESTMCL
jgi:hypothetical protein